MKKCKNSYRVEKEDEPDKPMAAHIGVFVYLQFFVRIAVSDSDAFYRALELPAF
ncbi:MAG: hypothetical protein ACLRXQ_13215 [Phascolarctobacterium faecium]